jgi:hypothetical protein
MRSYLFLSTIVAMSGFALLASFNSHAGALLGDQILERAVGNAASQNGNKMVYGCDEAEAANSNGNYVTPTQCGSLPASELRTKKNRRICISCESPSGFSPYVPAQPGEQATVAIVLTKNSVNCAESKMKFQKNKESKLFSEGECEPSYSNPNVGACHGDHEYMKKSCTASVPIYDPQAVNTTTGSGSN